MNIMQFLPAACFLLFVGCKSDRPISSVVIPDQSHPVASASPVSTTNIYYMIDKGPGSAIFIKQSDMDMINELCGTSSEGTKVVVVDGLFPPSTHMPILPTIFVTQSSRRDMSLIDDTGTR